MDIKKIATVASENRKVILRRALIIGGTIVGVSIAAAAALKASTETEEVIFETEETIEVDLPEDTETSEDK